MPISVNVSGMSYNGLSYAQRDAIEKQRKSRLTQVSWCKQMTINLNQETY